MSNIEGNAIFWIDVEKIHPNPYQPRREFNEGALKDLADSIRMYGVLQPLVVTRKEVEKPDGGLAVEYELISGERRTRAARLAGIREVPAIIRTDAEDGKLKLELAIIENLQREDLNVVDRARGFERLFKEFRMTHSQIGAKIGKSREYVSNSIRVLLLPEHMIQAVSEGRITEGHTRPLLMLADRKAEQETLFKEVMNLKLTVRETEASARKIAVERVRKVERKFDPEIAELENKIAENLGTRVEIEQRPNGGRIRINFFSNEDLKVILGKIASGEGFTNIISNSGGLPADSVVGEPLQNEGSPTLDERGAPIDDRSAEEKKADENDEDLYSLKNFSV